MAQYLKPDSELGYVEDNAEIERLKFNNLRHSVLGCMLGDFNEVGNYVVSPEIVSELIAMEKYIVQTYDNIELCKSVLKLDKQISFMVTFEGNKATLSLVEKLNFEANFTINSGTYSNINEYVLDSVETSGEINRNVVYARWNISPYGGNVVDIFSCDDSVLEKYFGIVNRFKYLLESNKILLQKEEKLEEIEANYANEIFEILKRYPKLEKVVVETVKQTLTENKDAVSVKKPFFAKTFNEVIENAIEKNINSLEEKDKKEFEQEKRNATLNLNIKREEIVEVEHQKEEVVSEGEIGPTIVTLKVPATTQSRTISELGEEFVSANKEVQERINKEENNKQSEKDKLVATLVGAGIGALVGGATGTVAGAIAGATVSEVVETAKSTKPTAPTKNKNDTTKTVAKKTQAQKPQKTDGEKPEQKKKTEEKKTGKAVKNKRDTNGQQTDSTRIFARYLAGRNVTNSPTAEETGDINGKVVNSSVLDIVKRAKEAMVTTEMVDNSANPMLVARSVEPNAQNKLTRVDSSVKVGAGNLQAKVVIKSETKTVSVQEIGEEEHTL